LNIFNALHWKIISKRAGYRDWWVIFLANDIEILGMPFKLQMGLKCYN